MPINLIRPNLVRFIKSGLFYDASDHNRSPVEVVSERIEHRTRMANGQLRKWHVADKRTFSMSWENLPNLDTKTADGKLGGQALEDFYDSTPGSFTLRLRFDNNGTTVTEDYVVMFSDFSKSIVKRWKDYELWNVTMSLEEV